MLTGVLLWVLVGIRAPPPWAAWLAIAGLATYACVVVRGASVDRALLVALVYLAAAAVDVRANPLALLGTVASVLVVADPLTVFDVGFALTFGATAGLLAVAPRLIEAARAVGERRGVTSAARGPVRLVGLSLLATLAAEAAVLPIAAAAFGRIAFAGGLLNLVAMPLMAVAQVAGMVTAACPSFAQPPGALAGWVAYPRGVWPRRERETRRRVAVAGAAGRRLQRGGSWRSMPPALVTACLVLVSSTRARGLGVPRDRVRARNRRRLVPGALRSVHDAPPGGGRADVPPSR